MEIIPLLLKELEQEAVTTRKMLKLVPPEEFGWKPHEKSMDLKTLAVHVAELPGWVAMGLHTTELDFAAQPYEPTPVADNNALLQIFEKAYESGHSSLSKAKDADLLPSWTLRTGDQVHAVMTKYELIRHSLAQTIHHRAQLGVFLRLLDIPIPGSYGPSADDQNF